MSMSSKNIADEPFYSIAGPQLANFMAGVKVSNRAMQKRYKVDAPVESCFSLFINGGSTAGD